MDAAGAGEYGPSHPLDVKRARATVSDDNRYARLRDSMHKSLEDRSQVIEKLPPKVLDVVVDYLFYQQHMLTEVLVTSVEPGDAVRQISMQARIEQCRHLAQEVATIAAMKRADNAASDRPESEE